MNYDLGHSGLLILLWIFPLAINCAVIIAVIIAVRTCGLATACKLIGAWFWSCGYGIEAFKAQQKLYYTRCVEQMGTNMPGVVSEVQ